MSSLLPRFIRFFPHSYLLHFLLLPIEIRRLDWNHYKNFRSVRYYRWIVTTFSWKYRKEIGYHYDYGGNAQYVF